MTCLEDEGGTNLTTMVEVREIVFGEKEKVLEEEERYPFVDLPSRREH